MHESTLLGTYYYCEDYKKPIVIRRKNEKEFIVSSRYWKDDVGEFHEGNIKWKKLGKGKIFFYTYSI